MLCRGSCQIALGLGAPAPSRFSGVKVKSQVLGRGVCFLGWGGLCLLFTMIRKGEKKYSLFLQGQGRMGRHRTTTPK